MADVGVEVSPAHAGIDRDTKSKTQFELGSDTNAYVPHNPANHHAHIQNRSSNYTTWSYQTGSVTRVSNITDYGVSPAVTSSGLYQDWVTQSANYDWMLYDY